MKYYKISKAKKMFIEKQTLIEQKVPKGIILNGNKNINIDNKALTSKKSNYPTAEQIKRSQDHPYNS